MIWFGRGLGLSLHCLRPDVLVFALSWGCSKPEGSEKGTIVSPLAMKMGPNEWSVFRDEIDKRRPGQ